jgi:ribosomal protein S18 acetylase RimI-like enzyme
MSFSKPPFIRAALVYRCSVKFGFLPFLFDTMAHIRDAMVNLEPIQQQDFERFLERGIREYAEDHVRNGNWSSEGALERLRKEFESLLPEGIHSKDQSLYSIMDDSGNKIGVLWVEVKDQKAFLYDFILEEAFRGKGYGKQSLIALDKKLKSMNVESVGLHVFSDNIVAQELYKKAGFQITNIHMKKELE